jgi:arylsulfatase A-like enzyme
MQMSCRFPEQLTHGALLGGFFGTLAAGVEFVLLHANNSYIGDLAKSYWGIMLPYVLLGLVGGVCLALVTRLLLGHPPTMSQHLARLGSTLVAVIVLSYLVVWATYQFLLPLWKLSNVVAYLMSLIVSFTLGIILYRIAKLSLERLERYSRSVYGLRVGLPLFLLVSATVTLYALPLVTWRSHAAYSKAMRGPHEAATAPLPDILFILVDTLRADHLPMYGYGRQTAPNLADLAGRGATFTQMYAPASATRPSVASIFSSLYPAVHKTNHERDFLSDTVVTLAEVLHNEGYQTFGVSGNPNVSPVFGFAQGFDSYHVSKPESAFRLTRMGSILEDMLSPGMMELLVREEREELETNARSDAITDFTLRWVERNFRGPAFLYVHYIDPHMPYNPPTPFDKAFDYRRNPPLRAGGVEPLQLISTEHNRGQVGYTIDQYDGEILYNDQEIGRLLAVLRKLGILDKALVIVTSDHGEEFWEHNQAGHDKTLYEEVVHVPFLISWPGQITAGSTYRQMANLVDVMPTILDFLAIKPPVGIQGFSFAKQVTQDAPPNPERKFFAQQINSERSIEMVRHQRYKFIRHLQGIQEGLEEFYDLQRDPLERTNLVAVAASQVSSWRKDLDTFNGLVRQNDRLIEKQQVKKLNEETIRGIRALGYLK